MARQCLWSMQALALILLLACFWTAMEVEGSKQKVKLTEVKTLTLQRGHMTTGRRSSPVPQLSCIYGGTVDCTQLYLPVVQCYNRGSDGVDVQWECKADMDVNYRFGHVQVVCEGYDYPDDPYILAGSCGLEYYVNYVPDKTHGHGAQGFHSHQHKEQEGIGKSWVLVLGAGIVVYAIYKTCIAGGPRGQVHGADGRSRSNDDFPDDHGRRPPPPGFRSDYFGSSDDSYGKNTFGSSSSGYSSRGQQGAGSGLGGGGFWTGAATGGLLGYMFGARNNQPGTSTGYTTGAGTGGGWFGGGGGTRSRNDGNWGSDPQPSTSSGFTHTTSGFGGTRRR